MRRKAVGIDFSGARDAGKRIWIAEGTVTQRGTFTLERCAPAFQRLNCDASRTHTLPALTEWLAAQVDKIIGCDFPFSLPRSAIDEPSWQEFVHGFADRYQSADDFRASMQRRHVEAERREPKRVTDRPAFAATPWNPWNIRLYRQTYAGIAGVLSPLVGRATIAPFFGSVDGEVLIVETCPASSLKSLGLYRIHRGYKGRSNESRLARGCILKALVQFELLSVEPDFQERIVSDKSGDALDSVIAALGAVAALPEIDAGVGYDHPIEGWVYFVPKRRS